METHRVGGILILMASLSLPPTVAEKFVTNETLLRQHLFTDCDCHVRPVSKWSDTLHVYLDYSPLYIHELTWYIPFLKWDPEDYGGVKFIALTHQDIWFPNLGLINSVDGLYGDVFIRDERQGKLYSDGEFRINRPGTWHTICMIDVTYFPFDQQICHVEIDSWTLPLPQLALTGNGSELLTRKMRPNGQWEIIDSWIHIEKTRDTGTSMFQTLSFVFKLKRKPQFVALNLLLPCIGILLLELIIFMIPPDAGEKISLGITLLLAQTVFQLVMHEDMPETSDQFPIFNLYILVAMILSGLEIVCSVVVLNYHHRTYKKSMSPFTRRVVLGVMATCLRVRIQESRRQSEKAGVRQESDAWKDGEDVGRDRIAEEERARRDADNDGNWIDVGRVIDRLFFYLFLFLTLGITLACFLVSYFSSDNDTIPLAGFGYRYNRAV